jgi:hypothetical protein
MFRTFQSPLGIYCLTQYFGIVLCVLDVSI